MTKREAAYADAASHTGVSRTAPLTSFRCNRYIWIRLVSNFLNYFAHNVICSKFEEVSLKENHKMLRNFDFDYLLDFIYCFDWFIISKIFVYTIRSCYMTVHVKMIKRILIIYKHMYLLFDFIFNMYFLIFITDV